MNIRIILQANNVLCITWEDDQVERWCTIDIGDDEVIEGTIYDESPEYYSENYPNSLGIKHELTPEEVKVVLDTIQTLVMERVT